jgi:hypothetical protein
MDDVQFYSRLCASRKLRIFWPGHTAEDCIRLYDTSKLIPDLRYRIRLHKLRIRHSRVQALQFVIYDIDDSTLNFDVEIPTIDRQCPEYEIHNYDIDKTMMLGLSIKSICIC